AMEVNRSGLVASGAEYRGLAGRVEIDDVVATVGRRAGQAVNGHTDGGVSRGPKLDLDVGAGASQHPQHPANLVRSVLCQGQHQVVVVLQSGAGDRLAARLTRYQGRVLQRGDPVAERGQRATETGDGAVQRRYRAAQRGHRAAQRGQGVALAGDRALQPTDGVTKGLQLGLQLGHVQVV